MLDKIFIYTGLALLLVGLGWMKSLRGGDSFGLPMLMMGGGVLLILFPGFRHSAALSGGLEKDKALARLFAKDRLNFLCAAGVMAGITGLYFAPGGVNAWTLGFTGLALASVALYGAGYALIGGRAAAANVVRIAFGAGGCMGLIVSAVTLITQLSGASDMPDRWNIYTLYGFLGLAASVYAIYYGVAYQTNLDVLGMLEPLGFKPADSGPLARDGRYDARGVWQGVDTLVNVDQTPSHKNSPPSFELLIRCELRTHAGRRLLAHPGGLLQRPLGAPFTLPKAEGPGEWAGYSVGCEPPEAAPALLSALGSPSSRGFTSGAGFTQLLLDGGRLTLGFSGPGYPSLGYLRARLDQAAAAARALEGAPGAGLPQGL